MVLAPAVTQFSKRSQVITYDLTSLVKPGKNDLVIWAGRGWYAPGLPGVVTNGPVLRAQMDILKNKEWVTLIKTDTSWKARNSGYYTLGTWKPGEFGGEEIDASMLLPDLTEASLKTAVWQSVIAVDIPQHQAMAQLTEGNIITDTINAVSVSGTGNKKWMADIGTTLTGLTEIRFTNLKKGQRIELKFCDHLDKVGKPVDQGQTDYYTASGIPGETFRNRFNYHGYRYIFINNLDSEPDKDDISAYPVRTGFSLASSFECSDPDMNAIHDMIFYTLQNLSLGGYLVDCPQIERLGYGGDGNASTETAQTMFDMAPLYRNWLQAWDDCLREDGGMPHTAPNPYPAGGGPYWCGFIITASWRTYMNYGDKRILEKYYPAMQKWIAYADKYSPSGLLEGWPETDYRTWYLGDWASPEGTDHTDKRSVRLVSNCFMVVCFETMEKISNVLGKNEESAMYATRKQKITELINSELFDKTNKIYGSGIQVDLTYPLLSGIVPADLKETITSKLRDVILKKHKGHIATGLVGIPVFTEWSTMNGEADLMYSMLKKREYPGYLYMIDNGATTTWEHWNGARSRIHNCYNGIGSWFYQSVGGIKKNEGIPAYNRIIIDPDIPEGITWANTKKETPYGTVKVNWTLEKGVFSMNINIPAGCTGQIVIPENTEKLTLNGKIIEKRPSFLDIESGEYNLMYEIK
jgi:alpha-L-rhamnosidase